VEKREKGIETERSWVGRWFSRISFVLGNRKEGKEGCTDIEEEWRERERRVSELKMINLKK